MCMGLSRELTVTVFGEWAFEELQTCSGTSSGCSFSQVLCLWGCDGFRVTMGLGRWEIKKLQTSLLSARFRPFSIKLTFLRLLPDIDFQNLEKVIFFLALLWLLWRSWFLEVLTLPFRQCFCCIFRKCFLGPGWIENLNTKTADLRLAPAEIWWVAPFVSIGLAQPSKICFHPFLPPNPLSFICPSVPLSLSPPFPPYFLSTSIYWPSL